MICSSCGMIRSIPRRLSSTAQQKVWDVQFKQRTSNVEKDQIQQQQSIRNARLPFLVSSKQAQSNIDRGASQWVFRRDHTTGVDKIKKLYIPFYVPLITAVSYIEAFVQTGASKEDPELKCHSIKTQYDGTVKNGAQLNAFGSHKFNRGYLMDLKSEISQFNSHIVDDDQDGTFQLDQCEQISFEINEAMMVQKHLEPKLRQYERERVKAYLKSIYQGTVDDFRFRTEYPQFELRRLYVPIYQVQQKSSDQPLIVSGLSGRVMGQSSYDPIKAGSLSLIASSSYQWLLGQSTPLIGIKSVASSVLQWQVAPFILGYYSAKFWPTFKSLYNDSKASYDEGIDSNQVAEYKFTGSKLLWSGDKFNDQFEQWLKEQTSQAEMHDWRQSVENGRDFQDQSRTIASGIKHPDPLGLYDCLELSGMEQSATSADIQKAFARLAFESHPDRHVLSAKEVKDKAEDKFRKLSLAYHILKHPNRRKYYDENGQIPRKMSQSD
ncbi:hypothetical protein MIR68_008582 [Amoeboaphelidium protococcarum]|nr:hypothetical protein MIR68_008582 [Amoeboaphelidium protococcarum]